MTEIESYFLTLCLDVNKYDKAKIFEFFENFDSESLRNFKSYLKYIGFSDEELIFEIENIIILRKDYILSEFNITDLVYEELLDIYYMLKEFVCIETIEYIIKEKGKEYITYLLELLIVEGENFLYNLINDLDEEINQKLIERFKEDLKNGDINYLSYTTMEALTLLEYITYFEDPEYIISIVNEMLNALINDEPSNTDYFEKMNLYIKKFKNVVVLPKNKIR